VISRVAKTPGRTLARQCQCRKHHHGVNKSLCRHRRSVTVEQTQSRLPGA
jgi:hypothetical protein